MHEPIPDWYRLERRGKAQDLTYFCIRPEELRPVVVLFGAGASYGCGHVRPGQPPLGPQLYGALKEARPTWTRLRPDLDEAFTPLGEDGNRWAFERGMDHLRQKLPFEFDQLLREMGYFFAAYEVDLTGDDAYTRLLSLLNSREWLPSILFSTLNYDRIFESAARHLGIRVHYGRHTPPLDQEIWLYKLHGSCNFVPPLYDFQGVPVVVDPWEIKAMIEGRPSNNRQVMSLYAPGKGMIGPTASWLMFMHRDWAITVMHAKAIVIVGVAPPTAQDQDIHLWTPLRATGASVSYVGGRQEFERLRGLRGELPTMHLGTHFADVFKEIGDAIGFAGSTNG